MNDVHSSQQDDDTQQLSQGLTSYNHKKCNPHIVDDDSGSSASDEDNCITQQTVDNNEFDDVSASQVLEDEEMQVGNYTKTRTEKDILIAKLLCRWWYVLPDWPPPNYNYREKLEEKKLKCYSVRDFEDHENVDANGYRKCYQISAFPGVFRDFKGIAYDLRPTEGKPCYNNMIQKTENELISLIKAAIGKQIEILNSSNRDETHLIKSLKEELAGLG